MMKFYQAPMEGLTGFIFRSAFRKYYGGADRYFTPFLVGLELSTREKNEVLPAHNEGTDTVPQILTNHAYDFVYMAERLRDRYGYEEVNLNLGCPSGTVASKNRGAGFLRVPDELDRFFDEVFSQTDIRISVKTRIGDENADDWERLLGIYNRYPISELIVHPRLRKQMYSGLPDMEAYEMAVRLSAHPLCYNGDINGSDDLSQLSARFPETGRVMCGRGLVVHPWLFQELKGEKPDRSEKTLLAFVNDIYENYKVIMSGDRTILYKMKEVWNYAAENYENGAKLLKKVRKCEKCFQYDSVMRETAACGYKWK